MKRLPWRLLVLTALALAALGSRPTLAQGLLDRIRERNQRDEDRDDNDDAPLAIAGEPFGVARVTIEGPPAGGERDAVEGMLLYEKNDRVFYPAFGKEAVRGLVRNFLNRPPRLTAYFLFRGNEPLELSLNGLQGPPLVLQPVQDPAGHGQLLSSWWRDYAAEQPLARLFDDSQPPPPQIKNYLTAMLSQRLKLRLPKAEDLAQPALDDPLGLLSGAEDMRLRLQQQSFFIGDGPVAAADQPLPQPIVFPVDAPPAPPVEIAVEPLAAHVPEECFYVRFGHYANFQWIRSLLSQAGGDIRNLITERGVSYGISGRMERQLVLKSSVLGDLFGGLAIADVALIGSDTCLREGGAIGLLFEARNAALLANNLSQQRQQLLEQNPAVKEQQLEIAGHKVSLLSTPDNSVRSFHAVDGNYHFVTSSQTLVRRFFEAGAGQRPLAQSSEFLLARSRMPLERDDTVFVFLSTAFMQNLVSPQYRIEMMRRLQASGDIELVQLAQLAAKCEGRPHETIEQLVEGRFLPRQFNRRPDGSRTILDENGTRDSLRGGRGSFVPVPDVELTGVTPEELADYQALAEYTQAEVQYLQPLIAGIQRRPLPEKPKERVVIDVVAAPYADSQFRFLTQWLGGQPDRQQLAAVPGDLVSLEAIVAGKHLFAGLRDSNPGRLFAGGNVIETVLDSLGGSPWENVQFYLGAASQPQALDFLGRYEYAPADPQGYAQSRGPFWRRQVGPFVVLSFHRDVLATVTPKLEFTEAVRPAHARLRVADLRGTQLAGYVDDLGGRRAEATCRGGARLLNSLQQQLHVAPQDALKTAEALLDARLVCPLGGTYVLSNPALPERAYWLVSDRPDPLQSEPQDGPRYRNPLLNWFRGLEGDVLMEGRTLVGHFEIDMELPPPKAAANGNGFKLPALDGFFPSKPTATPKPADKPADEK